jgi:hypothetical protein
MPTARSTSNWPRTTVGATSENCGLTVNQPVLADSVSANLSSQQRPDQFSISKAIVTRAVTSKVPASIGIEEVAANALVSRP